MECIRTLQPIMVDVTAPAVFPVPTLAAALIRGPLSEIPTADFVPQCLEHVLIPEH